MSTECVYKTECEKQNLFYNFLIQLNFLNIHLDIHYIKQRYCIISLSIFQMR